MEALWPQSCVAGAGSRGRGHSLGRQICPGLASVRESQRVSLAVVSDLGAASGWHRPLGTGVRPAARRPPLAPALGPFLSLSERQNGVC